jgi:hypothetical protein
MQLLRRSTKAMEEPNSSLNSKCIASGGGQQGRSTFAFPAAISRSSKLAELLTTKAKDVAQVGCCTAMAQTF